MVELTDRKEQFLIKLQARANKGDTLTDEESQVLSMAESQGVLPERDIIDRVSSQFQGETGLENLKGAGSLGVEVGGAIGGLRAGASLPVPLPLRPVTALAGAGIGAMGGNILAQLGIQGKEKLDVAETGLAGGLEVLFPGIGKLAQKGFSKGKEFIESIRGRGEKPAPFRGGIPKDLKRVADKAGVLIPVAVALDSRYLDFLDGIASKALFGAGTMKKQNETAIQFVSREIEKMSSKAVREGSPESLALQLSAAIKGSVQEFDALRAGKFKLLDVAAFGKEAALIDLTSIGKGLASFREAAIILEKSQSKKLSKFIKGEMRRSARLLDSKPIVVSPEQIAKDFGEGALVRELQEIAAREGLQSKGTFVKDLRTAFMLTDKTAAKFNETTIREIAKTKPDLLLNVLLDKGKPITMRAIMNMKDVDGVPILSDKLKDGLRATFLGVKGGEGGLLSRSTDLKGAAQQLSGKKLLQEIENFEGFFGRGASNALFPGNGLETTKRFAKFLTILEEKRSQGIGTVALFLQTPAAALAIVELSSRVTQGEFQSSDVALGVGAVVILFGPLAIARMLNNPKTFDRFAEGFKKRLNKPDDLMFYLTTIAAQMAKDGDDVRVIDQEETEELIDIGRKQQLRETQQGLLERLGNSPI